MASMASSAGIVGMSPVSSLEKPLLSGTPSQGMPAAYPPVERLSTNRRIWNRRGESLRASLYSDIRSSDNARRSRSSTASPAASISPSPANQFAGTRSSGFGFKQAALSTAPQGRELHGSESKSEWANRRGSSTMTVQAIKIDRARHMEEAFQRQVQEEEEAALADVTCPVNCVKEVKNLKEFEKVLADASEARELVVMDFFSSSCGACKYVAPQFAKLCKADSPSGIVFAKHNVRDEYDELTDLAQLYGIRVVPMFAFFRDGARVEQFPTRDKVKLQDTIDRLCSVDATAASTPPDLRCQGD